MNHCSGIALVRPERSFPNLNWNGEINEGRRQDEQSWEVARLLNRFVGAQA
jgi:hypothetical protein